MPSRQADQETPAAMKRAGRKNQGQGGPTVAPDVVEGTLCRQSLVGTLDDAVALLARMVVPAATTGTARALESVQRGQLLYLYDP